MKKKLILLFIFFASLNISYSQWVSQHTVDKYLADILFVNANTGFVAMYLSSYPPYFEGGILMTTDGGNSWVFKDTIYYGAQTLQYVGNKVYCFGRFNEFRVSTDFGNSWVRGSHPLEDLYSSYFIDENTGWIGEGGYSSTIYKTTNAGDNWSMQYNEVINFAYLKSIYFFDHSTGIATSNFLPSSLQNDSGKIIRTSDGGESWQTVYRGDYYDRWLTDISYNGKTAYVVNGKNIGGINKVLISTDQGSNWSVSPSQILKEYSNALPSTTFFDDNNGIITGSAGFIYRTLDGGSIWTKQSIPGAFVSANSSFINENTGWLIGNESSGFSNSKIYKTTNGGWDIPSQPFLNYPTSNSSIISDTIPFRWNFALNAMTYHLQVATDTSFTSPLDTNLIINNIVVIRNFTPNTYYWRVQANGVIGNSNWSNVRKFTIIPSGITSLNNLIPNSYELFQNYPNPFNPVTKIKFELPVHQSDISSNVKLTVYDAIGRKIAALVDEQLSAGIYEVEFDDRNFTTGIYFYKLEAYDFVETKRMILIK